jgi:hypothetical protein
MKEELTKQEQNDKHYFDLGIREGKNRFNWYYFIVRILLGIQIGALVVPFIK